MSITAPDAVVIRWCDVRGVRQGASHLDCFLSPQERQRRERFRNPEDALRFTFVRALCRASLSSICGVSPEAIAFETGPHGKPALPNGPPFNLSDSGDLVVMVIGSEGEVGLDVERIVDHEDLPQLAARYFARDEHRFLQALPDRNRRTEAFYEIWTVKEAALKAVGGGLSIPLDAACVTMPSDVGDLVLKIRDGVSARVGWKRLQAPLPGYALAVAREKELGEVRIERWWPQI